MRFKAGPIRSFHWEALDHCKDNKPTRFMEATATGVGQSLPPLHGLCAADERVYGPSQFKASFFLMWYYAANTTLV